MSHLKALTAQLEREVIGASISHANAVAFARQVHEENLDLRAEVQSLRAALRLANAMLRQAMHRIEELAR